MANKCWRRLLLANTTHSINFSLVFFFFFFIHLSRYGARIFLLLFPFLRVVHALTYAVFVSFSVRYRITDRTVPILFLCTRDSKQVRNRHRDRKRDEYAPADVHRWAVSHKLAYRQIKRSQWDAHAKWTTDDANHSNVFQSVMNEKWAEKMSRIECHRLTALSKVKIVGAFLCTHTRLNADSK